MEWRDDASAPNANALLLRLLSRLARTRKPFA
jgi:hypothetical protein